MCCCWSHAAILNPNPGQRSSRPTCCLLCASGHRSIHAEPRPSIYKEGTYATRLKEGVVFPDNVGQFFMTLDLEHVKYFVLELTTHCTEKNGPTKFKFDAVHSSILPLAKKRVNGY